MSVTFPRGYVQRNFVQDPHRRRNHIYYPETDEVFHVDEETHALVQALHPYAEVTHTANPLLARAARAAASIIEAHETGEPTLASLAAENADLRRKLEDLWQDRARVRAEEAGLSPDGSPPDDVELPPDAPPGEPTEADLAAQHAAATLSDKELKKMAKDLGLDTKGLSLEELHAKVIEAVKP
jgi:hypothetical protein